MTIMIPMSAVLRTIVTELEESLARNDQESISKQLAKLSADDLIKVISLSRKRDQLLPLVSAPVQAEVLVSTSDRIRKSLVKDMTDSALAEIGVHLDPTEMHKLLQVLLSKRAETIEKAIMQSRETVVEHALPIEPETAEGLMKSTFVIARKHNTVAEISDKITDYLKTRDTVPIVIVTDSAGALIGRSYLARLLDASASTTMAKIVQPVPTVSADIDREEIVKILRHATEDDSVVVIDEENRPVGVVHARDLLVVMEDEVTEDLYGFAGVYGQERPLEPVGRTVKLRYRWLLLNLCTALLASSVVRLFEGTLSEMVILAAYMPVVAGMGGNAGTQTLAVVVRGLSLDQIPRGSAMKVLLKETVAAVINGAIVGGVLALIVSLWHNNVGLGLVLWISMILALLTAGLFGTVIPILLKKFGYDPAISSSIFLTTLTDVIGFLTFLGLSTLFLL